MPTELKDTHVLLPQATSTTPTVAGALRYNTTKKSLDYYNGKESQWSSLGVVDGQTPSSAFSSVSQIVNFGYTGRQSLWTTFGNRVTATQVLVDFDTAGGPWIIVSFDFVNGIDSYNDTVYVAGANNNHQFTTANRADDTGNIGLGDGSLRNAEIYGTYLGTYSGDIADLGGASIPTSSSYSAVGPFNINYYNHASTANFTTTQVGAMQDWVQNLCPLIPHVAMETDAQGQDTGEAYDSVPLGSSPPAGSGSTSGQQTWIKDKDGYWMRATVTDNSKDESSSAYIWTESTLDTALFDGGSLTNTTNVTGASGGLRTVKHILPTQTFSTIRTGGGSAFGTPYVRNFDGGSGNKLNSRTFFLIKG